jgi:hypothetical protein
MKRLSKRERRKGGSGSITAAGGTPDPWIRQVFASDKHVKHCRQLVHLGEVHISQVVNKPVAFLGELQAHHAAVAAIWASAHKPRRLGAVYQPDDTVRAQQQVVSDLANGWRHIARMPLNGYQELVLNRRKTDGTALLFTPVQETAQANQERKGILEIAAGWLRQSNTPLVGFPNGSWFGFHFAC